MLAHSRAAWAWASRWQTIPKSNSLEDGARTRCHLAQAGDKPCPLTDSRGSLVPAWILELRRARQTTTALPQATLRWAPGAAPCQRKPFNTSLTLPSCISAGKCGTISILPMMDTWGVHQKHLCVPSREWEGTNSFPNGRQRKKQAQAPPCSQSLVCSTQHVLPNTCQQLNPSQHSAGVAHSSQQECQEITTGKRVRKTGWRQRLSSPIKIQYCNCL